MFRKIVIVLIGAVLLLGGSAIVFQKPIGQAIIDRVVEQRASANNVAKLVDGLHVGLCGTGSPLPNAERAGPCNVVIAGEHVFVVDIGEGGARNLNLMGIPMGNIDGVFLTHLHSDHIDGMGPLLLFHWTQAATPAPLPVYGPNGVERVIAGFNEAYAIDATYRIAHHGEEIVPSEGFGGKAIPFETSETGSVVFEKDGLKVTAFLVDHRPVSPAVGYRFDYKGRSIVISGDTAKSSSLQDAAQGADVLVHEALQPALVASMTRALEKHNQPKNAQITRDIVDYHSTPEQAAEIARAANVRQLVLSHIVPPIPSAYLYPLLLGDAAENYDGPIAVGEDGMLFSLPAGRDEIEQKSLL